MKRTPNHKHQRRRADAPTADARGSGGTAAALGPGPGVFRTVVAGLLAGALHNGLLVLALPPADLWPLIFVALVPLLLVGERSARPRLSALGVWLGGWAVWLYPHAWLIDVTALGYPLLAAYQALYPTLFVLIWSVLRGPRAKRSGGDQPSVARRILLRTPAVVLAPVFWVGLEYFRGSIFGGGYAWYLLGHPAINALVLCQIADLVGTYGVSLLVATVSGCVVDLLARPLIRSRRPAREAVASVSVVVVAFGATIGYGLVQLARTPTLADVLATVEPGDSAAAVGGDDGGGPGIITIAAVQTNLPQSNKMGWGIDEQIADFANFVILTRRAAQPRSVMNTGGGTSALTTSELRPPDLICWPETMVPGAGLNPEAQAAIIATEERERIYTTLRRGTSGTVFHQSLLQLADMLRTPLLVGSLAAPQLDIRIERFQNEAGENMVKVEHVPHDRRNSAFVYFPDPVPGLAVPGIPSEAGLQGDPAAANGVAAEVDAIQYPARYDKIVLTPFGEVMPFVHRWPALQQRLLDLGAKGMSFDLSPGVDAIRFSIPGRSHWQPSRAVSAAPDQPSAGGGASPARAVFRVATPICFESTVSRLCRRLVWEPGTGKSADVLVNLTNDGWFGASIAGREQHLQIGRFRAIENRVPMVRAANTGISAAIDSAGRILVYGPNVALEGRGDAGAPAPAMSEGVLVATLALDERSALFARIGDAVGALCLMLTVVCLAAAAIMSGWQRPRKTLPAAAGGTSGAPVRGHPNHS